MLRATLTFRKFFTTEELLGNGKELGHSLATAWGLGTRLRHKYIATTLTPSSIVKKVGCCWVVKHLKRREMASITARRNLDKKAEELFKETHCKYYKRLLFRVISDFDCSRHFSKHQHRSMIRAHLYQCLWELRGIFCITASFVWIVFLKVLF